MNWIEVEFKCSPNEKGELLERSKKEKTECTDVWSVCYTNVRYYCDVVKYGLEFEL